MSRRKADDAARPDESGRGAALSGRPSPLVDTRVICRGDNLEQLARLPDECADPVCIDPPFNGNRNCEVFWGETRHRRSFEDRRASTLATIEFIRGHDGSDAVGERARSEEGSQCRQ